MRIFLVWTLFLVRAMSTGGQAVTGPKQVTVEQGHSLAVSCSYKPAYKLSSKYWCRKNFLWFCWTYVVQTNGSEVTVTGDRVSIRDNHTAHTFTVTLSSVTPGYAGWYSCGVKRTLWINLWHSIEVMVSAAVSNTIEDRDTSLLTTNPLCPKGCGDPPVPSQLSVIYLLLLLSIKVTMALAMVCGAAWMRSRCRSRDQENLQLLEVSGNPNHIGAPRMPS